MPLRVDTVEPRAFVLQKWHVSQQPDRNPLKKHRDAAQARLVGTLLHHELTVLATTRAVSRFFPAPIRQSARDALDDFDV